MRHILSLGCQTRDKFYFRSVIGAQQGRRPSALQFTGGRDVFAQTDRNDDTGGQLSVADLDLDNRLKRKYFCFKKIHRKKPEADHNLIPF